MNPPRQGIKTAAERAVGIKRKYNQAIESSCTCTSLHGCSFCDQWEDAETDLDELAAELASIEQENQKLKQLQAETEVSLLVVRVENSRLQQENQRLREIISAHMKCTCAPAKGATWCPKCRALATDTKGGG